MVREIATDLKLSEDQVERVYDAELRRLTGARIRSFVPVIVSRIVKTILGGHGTERRPGAA